MYLNSCVQVDIAEDGLEALQACQRNKYQVIVRVTINIFLRDLQLNNIIIMKMFLNIFYSASHPQLMDLQMPRMVHTQSFETIQIPLLIVPFLILHCMCMHVCVCACV